MKFSFGYWLVGLLLGFLSSPLLQPEWPSWPLSMLLIIAVLVGISAARQGLAWLGHGSLLVAGVLCAIWWSLFNLKVHHSWTLFSSEWRSQNTVTLKISSFSVAELNRLRIEGCLLKGPVHWPKVQGCKTKLRLYWYGSLLDLDDGPRPPVQRPKIDEQPRLGEQWVFEVRLRPPAGTLNDGAFDYQKYLNRHGIRALGSIQSGQLVKSTSAWTLSFWRQQIFEAFLTAQQQAAPGELQSIDVLLALALGERQWMSSERWWVLQRTGLAHLMAISGLHLTLVFGAFWVWIRALLVMSIALLNRVVLSHRQLKIGWSMSRVAMLAAWSVVFIYAALAGFSVATVRALLLISFFVLLRLSGSRTPAMLTLLYAIALLWMMDPFAILDRGFWLSAGAVAAIFFWHWRFHSEYASGLVAKVRALWRLEVMLLIALAPLTLLFFNGLSWVAPLTNLIVIPIFTVIVIPFLLLSIPLVWIGMSAWSSWIWNLIDKGLTPLLRGLEPVAAHPWSWTELHGYTLLAPLLGAVIYHLWPANNRRRLFIAALAVTLSYPSLKPAKDEIFAMHVLDVGQGNALVLQRGRRAWIVDAGPAFHSGFDMGENVVVPFLKSRGLTPEFLMLTHAHQDHIGGADAIRRAFPNIVVLGSGVGDIPCRWGQVWQWYQVRMRMLAPLPGPSFGPNNDSCVLSVEWQQQRILLAGDSEWFNELRLVGRYGDALKSDILLVPHHGSRGSSQEAFLDAVAPTLAVVSRGVVNPFSMPHEETVKRYQQRKIRFYDTGKHGQVSLIWQSLPASAAFPWRVELKRPEGATPWYHRLETGAASQG